jgi:hypothetical protein
VNSINDSNQSKLVSYRGLPSANRGSNYSGSNEVKNQQNQIELLKQQITDQRSERKNPIDLENFLKDPRIASIANKNAEDGGCRTMACGEDGRVYGKGDRLPFPSNKENPNINLTTLAMGEDKTRETPYLKPSNSAFGQSDHQRGPYSAIRGNFLPHKNYSNQTIKSNLDSNIS